MMNTGIQTPSQKQAQRIGDFLRKQGMHHETIDFNGNMDRFILEMENGLAGKSSSLPMIPTYISMEDKVPHNEPVIVIDAGGTNLRVAVVHFDNQGKPVVSDFRNYPMPGTQGKMDRDSFFSTMAGYLEPVLHKSEKIGFCFSYPTEIFPNRDGKLLYFTKEVKVTGMDGEMVGEGLLDAIEKKGFRRPKHVVLLNDTVATLLGGKAAYPNRIFDSYIGFILGTGTNTCYVEQNSNIVKLPEVAKTPGNMLINVESGGYEKAPRGMLDEAFDKATVNPGRYAFEKMIAGGYQGNLMHTIIEGAVAAGLFSKSFGDAFGKLGGLQSKDVDDFLFHPKSETCVLARCCGMGDTDEIRNDRYALYHLIDVIIERAAKLTAINLTVAVVKCGKGFDPLFPVCIAADGSTFYKSKLFRGKMDFYVAKHLNAERGLYCEFVKAENANLIGTAIAGLM